MMQIEHVACHKGNDHRDHRVDGIRRRSVVHEITSPIQQVEVVLKNYDGCTFKDCGDVVKDSAQQYKKIAFPKGDKDCRKQQKKRSRPHRRGISDLLYREQHGKLKCDANQLRQGRKGNDFRR